MTNKRIYRLYHKETGKTIAWFTDFDDMLTLDDWYGDDVTDYDEYRLVEKND